MSNIQWAVLAVRNTKSGSAVRTMKQWVGHGRTLY